MSGDDSNPMAAALRLLAEHGDTLRKLLGAGVPTPPSDPAAIGLRMTVKDLWPRYWAAECHTLDSASTERGRMKVIMAVPVLIGSELRRFGDVELGEISPSVWLDLRARRVKAKTKYNRAPAPATRNRELSRVQRMLAWATEPGQRLIRDNPLCGVPKEKEDNVRRGKISTEQELDHLLSYCDPEAGIVNELQGLMVCALTLALLDTGMRAMEFIGLRWDEFDHDSGKITILAERRKTNQALVPRLSKRALTATLAIPRVAGCPYIFANPETRKRYHQRWITELFDAVMGASGLCGPNGEKLTPHSLRHSFVFKGRRYLKLPERTIMAMTGHKTRSAFERYGIVDQEEMDAGYDVRDRWIDQQVNGRRPPRRHEAAHTDQPTPANRRSRP